MTVWNKKDVLALVEDWRTERDPVAEAVHYAELMATIITQWALHVPETVVVQDGAPT